MDQAILSDRIQAGIEVGETLRSKGWERIQVILDRMIIDTIGGKDGDKWLTTPSKFSGARCMNEKEVSYLLGYRQALADFNNHVHNIVPIAKKTQDAIDGVNPVSQQYDYGETYGNIS